MSELDRVIGKMEETIEQGLEKLVEEQYILWPDRPYQDKIITTGLGASEVLVPKVQTQSKFTDYWTQYRRRVML